MGKFPIPLLKFLFEKKGGSECSLSLLARNKKTKRDCFAIARNDNKVSCYCEPAKGERGNPVVGRQKVCHCEAFLAESRGNLKRDCFVASLLAMTGRLRLPRLNAYAVRLAMKERASL